MKCRFYLKRRQDVNTFFKKNSEILRFWRVKTREIRSESFEAGGLCDNFVTKADPGGDNDEAREPPTSLRYLYDYECSEV